MRTRPEGFTLPEVLAALTLTALLCTALLGTAVAQMRLARIATARAAAADGVRTTAWVLGGEARRIGERDIRAQGADSLALRAFRGAGIVCAHASGELIVRYAGDRLPEPRKDSVIVVTGGGAEWTAALDDVADAGAACVAGQHESILRLRVMAPPADAAFAIVFEAGAYYLSSRALRYRVGAEGRQPLTAEVLGTGMRFHARDARGVVATVRPDDAAPADLPIRHAPPPRLRP